MTTKDRFGTGSMSRSQLPRRTALRRLSVAALLAAGSWPGALGVRAKDGGKSFKFIAVNDLHHDAPGCDPYFEGMISQMKRQVGIEFILVLGDLTDKGTRTSLGAIRDHLKGLGIPFYVQIGNHDYLTPNDRKPYEEVFPNQLNYVFRFGGWQFVGIDTTQGQEFSKTKVQPATLTWMDHQLPQLDKRLPTLLFTHFPLGPTAPMAPLNAEDVLTRFLGHNLKGVYSGHHHGFTLQVVRGVDVLTNRCCSRLRANHDGVKEKGYWVVTAGETGLVREFVEYRGV